MRWNHNIHYHRLLTEALAPVRGLVLDVGCGDGQLCRSLARSDVRTLVGVDRHAPSVALARSLGGGVSYLEGDFFELDLEAEAWHGIVSVAALHHMDLDSALERVSRLLRPGGIFAAVGLARSRVWDLPWDVAGALARPWCQLGKRPWEHRAPLVWPPPHSYGDVRTVAREILPGVTYRRHVLFRYSLVWRKPGRLSGISTP